jgi:hypothetical protein
LESSLPPDELARWDLVFFVKIKYLFEKVAKSQASDVA